MYPLLDCHNGYKKFYCTVPRYLQYCFQKFPPNTSVAADTITFDLNKFDAANLYMLNHACIEIRCKILKADGKTFPDKAKKVW